MTGLDHLRIPRTLVMAALLGAAMTLLMACRVDVAVTIEATADGSGRVEVLVGFDQAALARLGDPATALAVDDLRTAGWQVEIPATAPVERAGSATTWVRASRAFEGPDGLAATLDEVAGAGGPLAGTALEVDEGLTSVTTRLTGVVDLSQGLTPYGDADLDAATGGVPFGGLVATVEAEEGQPVTELIDVQVTFVLDGESRTLTPALGDSVSQVVLASEAARPWWWVGPAGVALAVLAAGVGGWWMLRRGRRRRRDAPAVPPAA
jgi:hypothetical protein